MFLVQNGGKLNRRKYTLAGGNGRFTRQCGTLLGVDAANVLITSFTFVLGLFSLSVLFLVIFGGNNERWIDTLETSKLPTFTHFLDVD